MGSNDLLVEMLKTVNGLRDDMKENKKEILTIVNDLKDEVKENRKEIQKSREIEEAHWQENLRRWNENDKKWEENNRRWDENDKRWEENERRWDENDKRWEENDKRWDKYEINRQSDRKFLLDTLTIYDISISEQLGDPNVEKMKKIVV